MPGPGLNGGSTKLYATVKHCAPSLRRPRIKRCLDARKPTRRACALGSSLVAGRANGGTDRAALSIADCRQLRPSPSDRRHQYLYLSRESESR